ncbi:MULTISPECIES: hypothetical protein [Paenibacillus]|nr:MULTISPECIES: hypothetical protein [Paenibacillus]
MQLHSGSTGDAEVLQMRRYWRRSDAGDAEVLACGVACLIAAVLAML